MKTEEKYISYREDRNCYVVSIKHNKKVIQKHAKTLEDAIRQRDSLLKLLNLDEKIIENIYAKKADEVPTLKDGFTEFVENEVRQRVALSTYTKYNLCKNTYCKYLGDLKINEITRQMWQDVFIAIQENRNLSYTYMIDDFRRFRAMYEYFIEKELIRENPLQKSLKLHKTHKQKRRAFSEEEKEKFLQVAKEYDYKYYVLFTLYFNTGARRGEILALQWQDVDFDNKMIHICKSIGRGTVENKFTEEIGQVKTVGSVRYIPISSDMCQMLSFLYNSRKSEDNAFVFTPNRHVRYPFISLGNVERAYTLLRKRAGLDKSLTIHCIRHYVASKLLNNGVDISTVQAIGGWTSPQVLLSVYAHSNIDTAKQALQRVIF